MAGRRLHQPAAVSLPRTAATSSRSRVRAMTHQHRDGIHALTAWRRAARSSSGSEELRPALGRQDGGRHWFFRSRLADCLPLPRFLASCCLISRHLICLSHLSFPRPLRRRREPGSPPFSWPAPRPSAPSCWRAPPRSPSSACAPASRPATDPSSHRAAPRASRAVSSHTRALDQSSWSSPSIFFIKLLDPPEQQPDQLDDRLRQGDDSLSEPVDGLARKPVGGFACQIEG